MFAMAATTESRLHAQGSHIEPIREEKTDKEKFQQLHNKMLKKGLKLFIYRDKEKGNEMEVWFEVNLKVTHKLNGLTNIMLKSNTKTMLEIKNF